MFKVELGSKARDSVTGFNGIVTGRAEYMTGCRQYCLSARAKGGKVGESAWFDEDRLIDSATKNPGGPADCEAPTK